jgi:hypothetical protein
MSDEPISAAELLEKYEDQSYIDIDRWFDTSEFDLVLAGLRALIEREP